VVFREEWVGILFAMDREHAGIENGNDAILMSSRSRGIPEGGQATCVE
jgi:hypothetical protein